MAMVYAPMEQTRVYARRVVGQTEIESGAKVAQTVRPNLSAGTGLIAGSRAPDAIPIPVALNIALVAGVFIASFALLAAASHATAWWQLALAGIAFSYLGLTNYFIFHEATHDILHPSPRINHLLGFVSAAMFPIPFSLARITHQNHHARNRTDTEMFDLYYPTDNRLRKYVQWYGILLGFFWPIASIGSLLMACAPAWFRDLMIRGAQTTGGYNMSEVRGRVVHVIRVEAILILAIFATAYWLLGLKPLPTLFLYACFAFNWSTRQYIAHAFAPRHIVEGTWNLRHVRVMSWLLLFSEYNLNHHRYPTVPWIHLPRLSPPGEKRLSYVYQYWRQWLGPQPATEPAPDPLEGAPPRAEFNPQPPITPPSFPAFATDTDTAASPRRWRIVFAVTLFTSLWFVAIYGGCDWITRHRATRVSLDFAWERSIPFVPAATPVYLSLNLLLATLALSLRRTAELLAAGTTIATMIAIAGACFLAMPSQLSYPPLASAGAWQPLFRIADTMNLEYNLLPSLHVALATFAALVLGLRGGVLKRMAFACWAVAIAASTLLLHQHHVLDAVAGFALAIACHAWIHEPLHRRFAAARVS